MSDNDTRSLAELANACTQLAEAIGDLKAGEIDDLAIAETPSLTTWVFEKVLNVINRQRNRVEVMNERIDYLEEQLDRLHNRLGELEAREFDQRMHAVRDRRPRV